MQSRRGDEKRAAEPRAAASVAAEQGAASSGNARLAASVSSGLAQVFNDFEILDRDLELGEDRRVQFVGIDAAGRLVLVLIVPGDGVDSILAALDAIAFAQRNGGVLADHLQSPRLRPDVPPVVALVADSFAEKLLGRLAGLSSDLVRLFEMRTVTSARGEHVYLTPITPGLTRATVSASRAGDTFVRALPEEQRELADLLLKRINRIDDQLVSAATETSVTWRLVGELVCCVMVVEERLEGQVPPHGRPRRISSIGDVESFVDQALQRYVALLGTPAPEEDLPRVDPGPILTPEEIEAFRQPG